jgi:2-furoyl-CoA dehydrogenase FAD binding subunit
MKPASFDMIRPRTLDEALLALQETDDAKIIAGGQSLVPSMNFRLATPALLVDLNSVAGLSGVRRDGDRLIIGTMTRQATLLKDVLIAEHAPLIAQAASYVGHVQTRSRGTIGGSLVHFDPSAELPLAMVVLGAQITLARSGSRRTIPASEFFLDALTTTIEPDEILIEIAIPIVLRMRSTFREYAHRHGDFALVSIAAQVHGSELALGIGGLASVPLRCRAIEDAYAAGLIEAGALDSLIESDLDAVDALGDLHASAAYRKRLASVLIRSALDDLRGTA